MPSSDAQRVAEWVSRSAGNGGLPYMIVDKIDACLFLFAANGTLRATTPVLLGLARGDDSPPRIGTRKTVGDHAGRPLHRRARPQPREPGPAVDRL